MDSESALETAAPSMDSENETDNEKSPATLPEKGISVVAAAVADSFANFRSPMPVTSEELFQKPDEFPVISSSSSSSRPSGNAASVAGINYKAPEWASLPTATYSLEVLKNGVVVDNITLSGNKTYFVVGRLPGQCDICSEHPSSSRFHAVFQHGRVAPDLQDGFYLYDLNSTHGTFLNKTRVEPETFIRLRVGFMVKFGSSTRIYILHGPVEDEEEDSGLTITQIKELQARKLESILKKGDKEKEKDPEDTGIDWGFGEDATEDEGGEEKEIGGIFGSITMHDAWYSDDPKKALNAFYLREGMDMESDIEEIGHGNKKQYHCRIALPIDAPNGRQLVADATANRKKDALAQAVLEACRLLEAQGALKGTTSIGRRQKGKNWADEDFYDSDEDTYTDRTGTVERKRQQRIQRSGKQEQVTETFESLTVRLEVLKVEVEEITAKIQKAEKNKAESIGAGGLEDLDKFMDAVKAGLIMDPKTRMKLKQRLAELKQEEVRLIKIVNRVRPLDLPAVQPMLWKTAGVALPEAPSTAGRIKAPALPAPAARIYDHDAKGKFVVEEDDTDEISGAAVSKDGPVVGEKAPASSDAVLEDANSNDTKKRPMREDEVKLISTPDTMELPPAVETDISRPYLQPVQQPKKRKQDNHKHQKVEYDPSDPDYAMWIPPEDQAGDGKTSLNDRLGY